MRDLAHVKLVQSSQNDIRPGSPKVDKCFMGELSPYLIREAMELIPELEG